MRRRLSIPRSPTPSIGQCARSSATPPACTSTVSARRRSSIGPVDSVAALVGGDPAEVVFTSGGTESDNFALRGAAEALELAGRKHVITSAIEHEAVLQTVKALARRGWRVTLLPVTEEGLVTPETLASAIEPDTSLVSIMHANNEIGSVQPIRELCAITHAHKALFHTDAVQSAGKIPVDARTLGVDLSRFLPINSMVRRVSAPSGSNAGRGLHRR